MKKVLKYHPTAPVTNKQFQLELHSMAKELIQNTAFTRTELLKKIIDGGGKDLNKDCGYPDDVGISDYEAMYAREGVAGRIISVWPEECWSVSPEVYEKEDAKETTVFEEAWQDLVDKFNIWATLFRADVLSGIGRFGIILIGIDDGQELNMPVEGWNEENGGTPHKLLYMRPFQESVIQISQTDNDKTSPRFGMPVLYNVTFNDGVSSWSASIHWHRVIHITDNREMSDSIGIPRMQKNYNRLLDIRKVLGGSSEMFWKGGFPGLSFELNSDGGDTTIDRASIRKEMEAYMLGLQRYLAFENLTAKSLAPQVADPKNHLEIQLNAVAMSEGIPKRILFGSEQGELASTQDTRTWNRRVKKRQDTYLTPFVVRAVVNRFIGLGILPFVKKYFVAWPDLNTQTDEEKAKVAEGWANALSKFVVGDVGQVVDIQDFLSILGKLSTEQINTIMKRVKDSYDLEGEDDSDEERDGVIEEGGPKVTVPPATVEKKKSKIVLKMRGHK